MTMTQDLSNASVQDMVIHCEDTARTILLRVLEFYPPMLDSFVDELQKRINNVINDFISDIDDNPIPLSESSKLAEDLKPYIPICDDPHDGPIETSKKTEENESNDQPINSSVEFEDELEGFSHEECESAEQVYDNFMTIYLLSRNSVKL